MALIPILNLLLDPLRFARPGAPPRRRRARCACGACGAAAARSRAAARRTTPRAPTMRRNPRRRLQSRRRPRHRLAIHPDSRIGRGRRRVPCVDGRACEPGSAARATGRRRDARLRGSLRTARDSPMPQPAARPSRPPRTPTPRRSRAAVTSRTPRLRGLPRRGRHAVRGRPAGELAVRADLCAEHHAGPDPRDRPLHAATIRRRIAARRARGRQPALSGDAVPVVRAAERRRRARCTRISCAVSRRPRTRRMPPACRSRSTSAGRSRCGASRSRATRGSSRSRHDRRNGIAARISCRPATAARAIRRAAPVSTSAATTSAARRS